MTYMWYSYHMSRYIHIPKHRPLDPRVDALLPFVEHVLPSHRGGKGALTLNDIHIASIWHRKTKQEWTTVPGLRYQRRERVPCVCWEVDGVGQFETVDEARVAALRRFLHEFDVKCHTFAVQGTGIPQIGSRYKVGALDEEWLVVEDVFHNPCSPSYGDAWVVINGERCEFSFLLGLYSEEELLESGVI